MRRPRLELPGIPQHITHRGVDRGATFIDDEDFAAYLQALELTSGEQGVSIHGYVLMTNHVRLPKRGQRTFPFETRDKRGRRELSALNSLRPLLRERGGLGV